MMDAHDSGSEITGYACRAVGDGLKRVVEVFLPQEVVENFDTVRLLAVERTESAECMGLLKVWLTSGVMPPV